MAKPGRKRKWNAQRRATTRAGRKAPDHGTPELLQKRAEIVGRKDAAHPHAGDPLGVLHLAGHIDEPQMNAGWTYAVLRWRLFGKPMAETRLYERYLSGVLGPAPSVQGVPDDVEPCLRAAFNRGELALRDAGRLSWLAARSVAVEQRLPDWFWRVRHAAPQQDDPIEKLALQRGLAALADVYGTARRRADRR